jgi:hypothetical protein
MVHPRASAYAQPVRLLRWWSVHPRRAAGSEIADGICTTYGPSESSDKRRCSPTCFAGSSALSRRRRRQRVRKSPRRFIRTVRGHRWSRLRTRRRAEHPRIHAGVDDFQADRTAGWVGPSTHAKQRRNMIGRPHGASAYTRRQVGSEPKRHVGRSSRALSRQQIQPRSHLLLGQRFIRALAAPVNVNMEALHAAQYGPSAFRVPRPPAHPRARGAIWARQAREYLGYGPSKRTHVEATRGKVPSTTPLNGPSTRTWE